ncbi:MAG: hypothetical protein K0S65_3607 [Labilithrix sp.]|nr:hypothetical protein [Labilithrix sp.]
MREQIVLVIDQDACGDFDTAVPAPDPVVTE